MFLFRLALALGMTVRQLLTVIDSRELTEWQAYDALSPIGPERGDVQAALVATVLVNVNRGKDTRPAKLADFLLEWDSDTEQVDPEAAREAVKAALMRTMAVQAEAKAATAHLTKGATPK